MSAEGIPPIKENDMSRLGLFNCAFTPKGQPSPRSEKLLQEIDSYAEPQDNMANLGEVQIPNGDPRRHDLQRLAVETRRLRQLRIKFLPRECFGEVAWDILLALYIAQETHKISVTALTSQLVVPMTTILRWLSHLEGEGRICHSDHPTDRRIRHLALTVVGRREMDGYFVEVLRSSSSTAIA